MAEEKFKIELVYALPDQQELIAMTVNKGTTVEQAIHQSGILGEFPEIDLTKNKVGVFSRVVKLEQELRAGDRIEIYRPLLLDPKEIRQQRAEKAKLKRNG